MPAEEITRWGILGSGHAARNFVHDLRTLPHVAIAAVASRRRESARKFAEQFHIPAACQGCRELAARKDIDIVYIATPNNSHKDDCLSCLNAGKAVLCEKPFALNAEEAGEVIQMARQRKVFCMEAMWMRFMPLVQKTKALIHAGAIGTIVTLTADFGYPEEVDAAHRLFDPESGGGVLLDRGVYGISLAYYLLGQPARVSSEMSQGSTGVDEQSTVSLSYAPGARAILHSTFRARTSNEAVIVGSKGKVTLHEPFFHPYKISIEKYADAGPDSRDDRCLGQKPAEAKKGNDFLRKVFLKLDRYLPARPHISGNVIREHVQGNGYVYEAAEAMRCLASGELESAIMPLDETLHILETMDVARQQGEVRYSMK